MKVNEGEIGFNLYKGRGITTRGRRLWGSCRVDVSPVMRSGVARLPVVLTRWPAAEELTAFEQLRPCFRPSCQNYGACPSRTPTRQLPHRRLHHAADCFCR